MTKQELINQVAHNTGANKTAAEAIISSFIDSVKSSVKAGETIYIRGFATIGAKQRKEKIGRNITKNTSIVIPACKVPFFKAAPEFKNSLK